ncbi:hypothetical protein CY0110_19162 [Crocosphaera chwakensis CCY0110]|uniref:Uncharacterized protein n=1 Tax=Crocosphaera chwakensis CCY0110 TaxID=391612 RepID=A3IJG4_9CHRO|nr:hypothetical protein CY0110_19162 [Crocosphaera chwakensis CCY0110]
MRPSFGSKSFVYSCLVMDFIYLYSLDFDGRK